MSFWLFLDNTGVSWELCGPHTDLFSRARPSPTPWDTECGSRRRLVTLVTTGLSVDQNSPTPTPAGKPPMCWKERLFITCNNTFHIDIFLQRVQYRVSLKTWSSCNVISCDLIRLSRFHFGWPLEQKKVHSRELSVWKEAHYKSVDVFFFFCIWILGCVLKWTVCVAYGNCRREWKRPSLNALWNLRSHSIWWANAKQLWYTLQLNLKDVLLGCRVIKQWVCHQTSEHSHSRSNSMDRFLIIACLQW